MSTSRHGPFAVTVRDPDGAGGWRTVTLAVGDRWTRDDNGTLTIRRYGDLDMTVTVYPPAAWFGLRYNEKPGA